LFALFAFVLGAVESLTYLYGTEESELTPTIDEYASTVMYAVGISNSSTDEFVFKDLNFPKKALAVNVFLAECLGNFLIHYTDVFNLLAAVAVHDIASQHERFISSQNDRNVRSLLTYYDQMCTKINKINGINSRVMLIVYVRIVSWISTTTVYAMKYSNWANRVVVFTSLILHASAFILAADANKKVKLTMKTIL